MSSKKKNLLIISHTEHYLNAEGEIVGWGPTISEINHLVEDFETIHHIAFLYEGIPPRSALPYTSSKIKFIPLSPVGGKGVFSKLKVILSIPRILKIVHHSLKKVEVFQLRTPTGIGVFLIPYLTLLSNKKGWYKYAGNWNQGNPPLGYALQRWMLKRQRRKVTINGNWPDQPKHCVTCENPCLTLRERKQGMEVVNSKSYNSKFNFCFVGRLEDAKGVQRIIDAFKIMQNKENIGALHFIGDGAKLESYKAECQELDIPVIFHGFLEREKVFEIYIKCNFLILPSDSEGFPKVIAEAMNYGCIPIVSNVSSIGQYINTENGFIVSPLEVTNLLKVIEIVMAKDEHALQKIATMAHDDVVNFTFEHYKQRIQKELVT